MEVSAGIAILFKGRILLGHPTGQSHTKTWSIPKGGIEGDESREDAAVRETFEEVGIRIDKKDLTYGGEIVYRNKKNKAYKRVHWFWTEIDSLSDIGLDGLTVPVGRLQVDEIDCVEFYSYDKAIKRIFWRQIDILSELKYLGKLLRSYDLTSEGLNV